MGCPYVRNVEEKVMHLRAGPITITTGGAMHCPKCDGTDISQDDPKAPLGCVCRGCGHVLCYIPKC